MSIFIHICMKKYFIYKTTNLINKKYYIGAHSTHDENDSYLGSGSLLNKAISKYGKENFKREILLYCDNKNEMYQNEIKLIEEHINDPLCYNLKHGGIGGWDYVNNSGLLNGDNNPMKNPIIAKKCSESIKYTKSKNNKKYKDIAYKNLKKAIDSNTGKKRPKHSLFMKTHSKEMWKNNKEKMRDKLSSWFSIKDPNGNEYQTNRLQEFCLTKQIPYTTLWKSSVSETVIRKGKLKGWTCKKIIQK
jgi:hypothetical protein